MLIVVASTIDSTVTTVGSDGSLSVPEPPVTIDPTAIKELSGTVTENCPSVIVALTPVRSPAGVSTSPT